MICLKMKLKKIQTLHEEKGGDSLNLPLKCPPLWPSSQKAASLQWRCKPKQQKEAFFTLGSEQPVSTDMHPCREGGWRYFYECRAEKVLWLQRLKNMLLCQDSVLCGCAGLHFGLTELSIDPISWKPKQHGNNCLFLSRILQCRKHRFMCYFTAGGGINTLYINLKQHSKRTCMHMGAAVYATWPSRDLSYFPHCRALLKVFFQ